MVYALAIGPLVQLLLPYFMVPAADKAPARGSEDQAEEEPVPAP